MKLKIDVKDLSSCEKVLTIDLPPETVTEEFETFYTAVGKRAKIPGFRPGHAPKHVVALHFKEEAKNEVWKQLVSRSFRDAIRQKEIAMIGYPQIENVEFNENRLKFKAHVEMRPKLKIDKYVGLSVKRDPVEANESEIEETLTRIRESHAKFQAVEDRAAQLGDFLISDYALVVDGKEVEKREGEWIEIREKDFLEGFSKQLTGAKAGETKEVLVTFPADYGKKEFAGKTGHFLVTVKEIKEKKLPFLDDEFAKEVSQCETFVQLKDEIRRDLETHKKTEVERKVEQALLDELIKRSKFEIPSRMMERRCQALVEDRIQMLISQGVKQEDAVKQKDELQKALQPEAERQVRISFLLNEVAEREHLDAKEEDLEAKYRSLAERARRPLEEVKTYFSQDEDRRESLRQQIISEKTIHWLKDKAIVTENKK
ncbi:MAG: trigger factor [Candidatus Omnitrophica bacterium]|nr:trigger factor [Candidatus Omnitrophota bacterium]